MGWGALGVCGRSVGRRGLVPWRLGLLRSGLLAFVWRTLLDGAGGQLLERGRPAGVVFAFAWRGRLDLVDLGQQLVDVHGWMAPGSSR